MRFKKGDSVCVSEIFFLGQTYHSKRDTICCSYCMMFIGDVYHQAQVLVGNKHGGKTKLDAIKSLDSKDFVRCSNIGCEEIYCSIICYNAAISNGHMYECCGDFVDRTGTYGYSLMKEYKRHTSTLHSDIFLIAMKIICSIGYLVSNVENASSDLNTFKILLSDPIEKMHSTNEIITLIISNFFKIYHRNEIKVTYPIYVNNNSSIEEIDVHESWLLLYTALLQGRNQKQSSNDENGDSVQCELVNNDPSINSDPNLVGWDRSKYKDILHFAFFEKLVFILSHQLLTFHVADSMVIPHLVQYHTKVYHNPVQDASANSSRSGKCDVHVSGNIGDNGSSISGNISNLNWEDKVTRQLFTKYKINIHNNNSSINTINCNSNRNSCDDSNKLDESMSAEKYNAYRLRIVTELLKTSPTDPSSDIALSQIGACEAIALLAHNAYSYNIDDSFDNVKISHFDDELVPLRHSCIANVHPVMRIYTSNTSSFRHRLSRVDMVALRDFDAIDYNTYTHDTMNKSHHVHAADTLNGGVWESGLESICVNKLTDRSLRIKERQSYMLNVFRIDQCTCLLCEYEQEKLQYGNTKYILDKMSFVQQLGLAYFYMSESTFESLNDASCLLLSLVKRINLSSSRSNSIPGVDSVLPCVDDTCLSLLGDVYHALGATYLMQGKWEQARQAWNTGTVTCPQHKLLCHEATKSQSFPLLNCTLDLAASVCSQYPFQHVDIPNASLGNMKCRGRSSHCVLGNHGNRVFFSSGVTPVVDSEDCKRIISLCERYALQNESSLEDLDIVEDADIKNVTSGTGSGSRNETRKKVSGWNTARHYAVPTTDLPLHLVKLNPKTDITTSLLDASDVSGDRHTDVDTGAGELTIQKREEKPWNDLLEWFMTMMEEKIGPILCVQFVEKGSNGVRIGIHDAFVVKYQAQPVGAEHQEYDPLASLQTLLPIHTDQSSHSFILALNDHNEYIGGGTYFADIDQTIRPAMGHMVSFEGGAVLHGGLPITGGTRYILAVFLYISQMKEVRMIDGDIPKRTAGIDHEDGNGDTGHGNTGHGNTGHGNTGNGNTGHGNTGHGNTGHGNTGHGNTGHGNTGHGNTGHGNTGNGNTGHGNTGHGNTGHYNDPVRNCCASEGFDTNSGYHSLKKQKLSNHTTANVHASIAENKVTSYSFGFSFDTLK